ncbi:uncharacterized protein LOC143026498 isoform X2 [Oratosquilla oratoria]|uniref:uncharacterized protein LOC143026498 isoform X2 n=1 Tax=Oratosquilla oratoria TaxID=337810 RepID=UPI003F766AC7
MTNAMDGLEESLMQLEELSSKERKQCIETLIKIHRNITGNPGKEQYKKLRITNERVKNEVWQHKGGRLFLERAGWIRDGEYIHFPASSDASEILNVLVTNRNVTPNPEEWQSGSKHIVPNPTKVREEELRRKALAEKEKQMAELKKDMAERKEIANRILAEHRSDMVNKRVEKPSIAVPKGEGAVAKMSDRLPKGGG